MTALRIGIDGFNLAMPHGTGVATYGHVLAETLHAGGDEVTAVFGIGGGSPAARGTRLRIMLRGMAPFLSARAAETDRAWLHRALAARAAPPFARSVNAPDLFALAHRHFRHHDRFLPLRMTDPPTIMHWTYPLPVRLVGARNVYTLHDLVPLRLPFATRDDTRYYDRLVRRCVATGAHVCTVSEASRADILRLLGVAADRVTNTYQAGPPPPDLSAEAIAADRDMVARLYGLAPQGYFLFVGTIEPKKNVAALIDAYLATPPGIPLVLVGARGWGSAAALAALDRGDADGRVIHLDYAPRAQLLGLIRLARALLFPSLWEGFGLPVLEALQFGTPVLIGDQGGLPEVAGDAAVIVDPHDGAALSAGIRALHDDAALRLRLSAAGPARAALFSRARYLTRLHAMYTRILAGTLPGGDDVP
ncbi:glycosyltransferase family 4 protein [Sphingomonas profundi]|uniref:glycosyltransferase family 4 protein n=1 Tax=Alterirhizorhabdus profundi TaxID=2681549 RepID=UPI0012E8028A|nr:glycosyltransferase family 1 protein [Sphingomonas profundi]